LTVDASGSMERSNAVARATVLLSQGVNVVRALEARGIDADALLRRAGCDPALFHVPETRVPNRIVQRIFELAEEATGDPSFGLDVGQQVRGVALHAVGYAWLASATLGDAMARLARYTRVLNDVWHAEIRDEASGVRFIIASPAAEKIRPLSRHDAVLSGIVKLCRITYGDAFAPLEVAVEREPPPAAQRFKEWFRAPIVWGAPTPSLLCRREDLTRPLVTTNPDVVLASEKLVTDYLARLDRDDVVARVKRALLNGFPDGAPTQTATARALGMSARTLHRRLAEEGTSFVDLLDETRRELAAAYIRRSDYSVGEVAYLLGFAETSSFNRAFRRWTGSSPSEYRRTGTVPERETVE
jgi:AraC-like DNA-binding protein